MRKRYLRSRRNIASQEGWAMLKTCPQSLGGPLHNNDNALVPGGGYEQDTARCFDVFIDVICFHRAGRGAPPGS